VATRGRPLAACATAPLWHNRRQEDGDMGASDEVIHVRSDEGPWKPAGSPGIDLRVLQQTARGGTAVIRFQPGARARTHDHPGGEEIYVIRGRIRIGERWLSEGDYLMTPPGQPHDAQA
jgi:quercetin dioxygenase-like cupin family protein